MGFSPVAPAFVPHGSQVFAWFLCWRVRHDCHSCVFESPCCAAHRVFAFTRLNAHSSRSHAIVMLTIIKRHRTAPGQEEGPLQKVKIGKLFMVDLAGSERLKKSLSTGTDFACSLSQAQWPCCQTFQVKWNVQEVWVSRDHGSCHVPSMRASLTCSIQNLHQQP